MIQSMTGYGEAQHTEDGVSYALEVRSLNGRYLKISIKLPETLSLFEPEVEKLIRGRLTRGSVFCTLRLRDNTPGAAQEVNRAALESYVQQLQVVSPSGPVRIDLAGLLALPGVCQPPEIDEAKRQEQWKTLDKLTNRVLDHVIEMRKVEGRSLCDDLLKQCLQIRHSLTTVSERAPVVRREYHQRLLQRTNELIAESRLQLQLDDLKREVALYAERSDINEEITRLSCHLDHFESLCRADNQAGRKLDFLAQEMLREANTIGSKANDAEVAHHIVDIKGAIDRLKEQVQNVE
ncbi:MAG TPA: YicC/YloC family endoribonuclease [Phycisphaerae bacterium]|nr:YicC/YloC family endoribonuclease [Phycisphaerae bacterium]